ncbi:hypothetical protein VP01_1250g1 [Puccinia sorghi]|uniref:Uncharacterized protein n=1 Tax=Puccinia sorghi TaxID=27349 RepID=A0A0L6VPE7_9BASI|nr:hypothetical protein VP01_1250g1 [Puccinia sorghi]
MDSNFKHEDDGVGAPVSDGEDDSEEAQLDNEANSSNQQEPSATSRHLPAQDEVHDSSCPPLLGEEGKSHPATGDGPIGNQSAGDGPIGNYFSNCLGSPGQLAVCGCIASGTTRTTDSNTRANSPSTAPNVSLAGAFASATNSQFHIIESQLSIEQVRLEQEDTQAEKRDQLE